MTDSERPDDPREGEEREAPDGVEPEAEGTEATPEPTEPGPQDAEAGAESAGEAPETAEPAAEGDETTTESVEVWEPERPESAVPDQAPEPLPVEAPEDVAAPDAPAAPPEPEAPERPERARAEHRRDLPEDPTAGEEAIPGAHLEPDLVLEEEQQTAEPDFSRYADLDPEAELDAEAAEAGDPEAAAEPTDREEPAPAPRSALDLAAGARYRATGKRKTAVARVILRPGTGTYTVNGRPLDAFFPRATLQLAARQPLQTAGYEARMDVVARIHGGGVSAQAGALRHGVARALVEADPALRSELKRHGFLTRDARAKERRKAGLKKARKRPQFSKR
ncbi:MAG: 30S ribosomal protein S9 [Thermoleophilaceae bacterium]|nr:30S ribosomal protein S9 [Thermoleophilaceae bacterium]